MVNEDIRFPAKLIAYAFRQDGRPNLKIITGIVAFSALQATLVFLGSFVDGTLYLPGNGDGFLEHYGVWAILITDPLLLLCTAFAYRRFHTALLTLPIKAGSAGSERVSETSRFYINILNLNGRSIFAYILLVIVGALSWINNIHQTIDPVYFYGNDVFDGFNYRYGFLSNKLNLFNSWVFVYPIVGFQLIWMSLSVRIILQKLVKEDQVSPNVLHPDGCYGLLDLGILNIALLVPYLLSYFVIFCLVITHEKNYFTVDAALVCLTLALIAASYFTIGPITGLGRQVHQRTYERLKAKSSEYNGNSKKFETRFAFERLYFPQVSATPYTSWFKAILAVIRLTPIVLTASRFLP